MQNDFALPTQFPPVPDEDFFISAENFEFAGNSRVAYLIYRYLDQKYPGCFADKTKELSAKILAAKNAPIKRQATMVYATDNRGFKYLITSVASFLLNNRHIYFKIYVLIDHEFDYNNVKAFAMLEEAWSNIRFEFLLIKTSYSGVHRPAAITNPTFYRLELPQMVDDEEVLYVDIDTICASSIDELLDIDISDYYVAGVKAGWSIVNKAALPAGLLPSSIKNYVNAGVLKFNLANIRKDNAFKDLRKMIDQKNKDDQQIINILCGSKLRTIPLRFNCMTPYFKSPSILRLFNNRNIYSDSEISDATYNPVIIHYASTPKPWQSQTSLDWYYWDAAKNSPYFLDHLRERFRNDTDKAKILSSEAHSSYLQKKYFHMMGKPQQHGASNTYTDKIQLLSLYRIHPCIGGNRLATREYAGKTIGTQRLPELYGIWEHFRDIPFHTLPAKFYLKSSIPGVSPVLINQDENTDFYNLKKKLEEWHSQGLEQHVFDIPASEDRTQEIYAEEWLDLDYGNVNKIKLISFYGKIKYIWLLSGSEDNRCSSFMDLEWNSWDISSKFNRSVAPAPRHECLPELIYLAEKLASGLEHAVVSFYLTRAGMILFDKIETSIESGLIDFADQGLNQILGKNLKN